MPIQPVRRAEPRRVFMHVLQKHGTALCWGFFASAALALAAVVLALGAMEKKQIEDFDSLVQTFYKSSEESFFKAEARDLFKMISTLMEMPNVRYAALWVNGKREIQDGDPDGLDQEFVNTSGRDLARSKQGEYVYFSKTFQPAYAAPARQQMILKIAFSLQAFQTRKNSIIQVAVLTSGFLGVLMLLLCWISFLYGKLEQAERMRAGMIRAVRHEMINRLFVIKTIPENLILRMDRELPLGDIKKNLQQVLSNCRALEQMTAELSDYEKLVTDTFAVQPQAVDIGGLLSRIVDDLAAKALQKQQAIHWENGSGPATAWVDPLRTEQIVHNLLQNALKFSPPQSTVKVWLDCGNEEKLRICVCDQGPGISPAQWEAVFEEFTRLQPEVEGAGMGLNISRRLARLMGGDLLIEKSAAGQGVTFCLLVPRRS
ncbi:HAMP domain-containing histidine kinase [candidate division FCPU426 bacterium]|nr:HAMP domain-containing histidine kinase [candidate division FCPU426 bacterium]